MTDTAPATVQAPTEKKIDEVAVIFDLSFRAKQPSALSIFIGGQDKLPAPGILVIPCLPRENPNGVIEINRLETITLHFGTNMGIDKARWEELKLNCPPSLKEDYFDQVGCFIVIKPTKVGSAEGYHNFSETDAKTLVGATTAVKLLENYSEKESRGTIQLEVANQRSEIEADLAMRQQA
jgi:hypothetical protein